MRIASVNVNGVRAAVRKGMRAWIEERQPDVILMQETRAEPEIVAGLLPDWHVITDACRIKGRAGVAVALRELPLAVRHGVPGEESDVDSGRWLEVDVAGGPRTVTLVSAYLHSGEAGTEKMDLKYQHLDLVSTRLDAFAAEVAAGQRNVLVAGDFNVVRGPSDIKNFKPNHNKTAGVLDREMAYLRAWFEDGPWVDAHRALVPAVDGQPGPFTWWSQRGKAFDNNVGWRIDYHLVDAGLAAVASAAVVDRAPSYDTRWSDHAPLTIEYDLGAL